MARPIEPTPILTGKDAEKLRREINATKYPSPETINRLEKCADLYEKFSARRLTKLS